MARKGTRLNSNVKNVHVPDAVGNEFARLKVAGSSTQALRQYMNASGPLLIDDNGQRRPGLYTDEIITQMITDYGI